MYICSLTNKRNNVIDNFFPINQSTGTSKTCCSSSLLTKEVVMLTMQNVAYTHPNKDLLFQHINLNISKHEKAALIGNNGSGKSTLLKLIARQLHPSDGFIKTESTPYYVPQVFGQYNHLSVSEALRIDHKLKALHAILNGNVTDENLTQLDDDWGIEERCNEALQYWHLQNIQLSQKLDTLSGGQKTKVFLAGMSIHPSSFLLLDEPSNHLDLASRKLLYDFIASTTCSLLTVSHDRKLLNLLNPVCELNKKGIIVYGGNYNFYTAQKLAESNALSQEVKSKEKTLRKAKEIERDTMERQQKSDARGKKKQEKAGIATIMMNTLRNNAEKSTAKMKNIHAEKIDGIHNELQELRSSLPETDKMKFGFDNSALHKGKILFRAENINFAYNDKPTWKDPLSILITNGERIALKGSNGSGKTTLLKIISAETEPAAGTVYRSATKTVYVDQEYSLINNQLSVYEQAQTFNAIQLQEHEIKIRLSRFLFTKNDWDKPCGALSGGEKMRLTLCCLSISSQSPDIIILDEPTNNLDMQNIQILTEAINEYKGTLIVVSHDESFLEETGIERIISL